MEASLQCTAVDQQHLQNLGKGLSGQASVEEDGLKWRTLRNLLCWPLCGRCGRTYMRTVRHSVSGTSRPFAFQVLRARRQDALNVSKQEIG